MCGKVLDLDVIRAHDEGIEQGRDSTLATSICGIMKNFKLTAEEAMEKLDIPKGERSKYMTML